MPSQRKSGRRWLARQHKDRFVRAARAAGQVSRAHYKLAELDRRFGLLRPQHWVLELGAAPGGWTAYVTERLTSGRVIAVDPLPVAVSSQRLTLISGRVGEAETDQRLAEACKERGRLRPLDLVLSDMAPNISGVSARDQPETVALMELAFAAAQQWLAPGGAMVVKVMQGAGVDDWIRAVRLEFDRVSLAKPRASRPESREVYAVARGRDIRPRPARVADGASRSGVVG